MKITLSQFAGFCDGVERAYQMVMGLDMEKIKKPAFVLGSLVHNPEVVKKIEEKGILKIEYEKFFSLEKGEIGTIILTAHGAGPNVYEIAQEKGIEVIDTTCPKVFKVQRLAKVFFERGYQIVIVGDKDHKEVKGIDEWGGGKSIVISSEEDFEIADFSSFSKLAVLSQTTQSEKFFKKAVSWLKDNFGEKEIFVSDTICATTYERQEEVGKLAQENDVLVVVGSKTSANSGRLFEIGASFNPRTYFVENADEIEKKWFSGAMSAAVTAGASTPPWIIQEVLEKLSGFAS